MKEGRKKTKAARFECYYDVSQRGMSREDNGQSAIAQRLNATVGHRVYGPGWAGPGEEQAEFFAF
jgi:hypothetical protein